MKKEEVKMEKPGNAAEMREALENISNMGEQIDYQLGSSDETVYAFRHERSLAHGISECARTALTAPPGNCDKYKTAEEAYRAFLNLCQKEDGCLHCRFGDCETACECSIAWAYEAAEEEGAK